MILLRRYCANRKQEESQTPITGLNTDLVESQPGFFSSAFKMIQMRVTYCILWAVLGFPVPYISLALNHQLSSFLEIFPSHFLKNCAKGFRYSWFYFFLLGLDEKKPTLLWNVEVSPHSKSLLIAKSLSHMEGGTDYLPKWEPLLWQYERG